MEEKQDVLLEMKDLSISFYNKTGEIQAVRGISYTLHKGEVLGIVGEFRKRQVCFQPRYFKADPGYRKSEARGDPFSWKGHSENVQEGITGTEGQ